jgi:deoxycytidylate deaminase
MLDIVSAGIKKVVYYRGRHHDTGSMCANPQGFSLTEEIAKRGNVTLQEFKGNLNWMRDRIEWMVFSGIFE